MSGPRSATIVPNRPSSTASIARDPEPRREHAVVRRRRAAALDVAEDRHARLEPCARLDLALEGDADPAEALVAERVGLRGWRS